MNQYCEKETYLTYKAAQKVATVKNTSLTKMVRHSNRHPSRFKPYKCTICKQYHLTTEKKSDFVRVHHDKVNLTEVVYHPPKNKAFEMPVERKIIMQIESPVLNTYKPFAGLLYTGKKVIHLPV